MDPKRLISHTITPQTLEATIQKAIARIKQQGDKPYVSVVRQLEILDQLTQFDFGCYLLQNQGINGYWTKYMVTHPWLGRITGTNNRGEPFSTLEDFVLNHAPSVLATQQRFEIFLKENQTQIKDNSQLACIPSGLMGELLYLDYENISDLCLIGIDYDTKTLAATQLFAQEQKLSQFVKLVECDAWNLGYQNQFDLISSNGLNIYEAVDDKVTALYCQFYHALKPNGKLVTSFLTPPPALTNQCEWDMTQINQGDLLMQKILFVDIIDAKFQCYRTSQYTQEQLKTAGFKTIQFIYDAAKLFPTVVAYK